MFPNANCKNMGGDFFYPSGNRGRSGPTVEDCERESAKVCLGQSPEGKHGRVCPHKDECLQYALDNNEDGVYGGTTTADRKGKSRTGGANKYPIPVVHEVAS
jgi:hypothetical protein